MDNQKIANFISELRKEKNLTQKELADQLNITDKAVSKWERGQSYPDITILPPLCALLGVTVSELLNGERADSAEPAQVNMEHIVVNTLDYAQQVSKQRRFSKKGIVLLSVTVFFLVAAFVCSLCDFVITRSISWSLYPVGAVVLVWCVFAALLYGKRLRFVAAAGALTVLIIPFLALIEYVSKSAGWLIPVGLPIAAAALLILWLVVLLFTFTRINRWFILSLATLLSPLLDIFINLRLESATGHTINDPSSGFTLLGAVIAAIALFVTGIVTGRKKKA